MNYVIDKFQDPEKADVALLHKNGILLGFLSSLGTRFLSELYSAISAAPRSGVWVARESLTGEVLGFVAGTADIRGCYRYVLRHRSIRLVSAAARQVWKPAVFCHMFETLKYPGTRSDAGLSRPSAELLAIAVDVKARGMRIGRSLISTLEAAFRNWRVKSEYVVVTYSNDLPANRFYEKSGFKLHRAFPHHKRLMYEYRKNVPDAKHEVRC